MTPEGAHSNWFRGMGMPLCIMDVAKLSSDSRLPATDFLRRSLTLHPSQDDSAEVSSPLIRFVARPNRLPTPPTDGRLALIDIAFAHAPHWEQQTRPFIEALGDRLALWVDHHDHDAWREFEADPRFVLVPKVQARACPQLITPEVVRNVGPVQHLWAHADFDGCVGVAKFLCGGTEPYEGADEDARAIDAPGRGFKLSSRGQRLSMALDEAGAGRSDDDVARLLQSIVEALCDGHESLDLKNELDDLQEQQRDTMRELEPLIEGADAPHPGVLVVRLPRQIGGARKKFILRALEHKAKVAVLDEGGHLTVATFHDDVDDGLNLAALEGLRGQRGYAWGTLPVEAVLAQLQQVLS